MGVGEYDSFQCQLRFARLLRLLKLMCGATPPQTLEVVLRSPHCDREVCARIEGDLHQPAQHAPADAGPKRGHGAGCAAQCDLARYATVLIGARGE